MASSSSARISGRGFLLLDRTDFLEHSWREIGERNWLELVFESLIHYAVCLAMEFLGDFAEGGLAVEADGFGDFLDQL